MQSRCFRWLKVEIFFLAILGVYFKRTLFVFLTYYMGYGYYFGGNGGQTLFGKALAEATAG